MEFKIREHLKNSSRMSYITSGDDHGHGHGPADENILDCSLGINPFGFSKKIDFSSNGFQIDETNFYPDYSYSKLKLALSKYWSNTAKIEDQNIIIGNGSSYVLLGINKLFIDKGTKVLGYAPQFSEYITDIKCCGGSYDFIKLRSESNYKFDVNEFIEAIKPEYTLLYLDNPNNPTGQIIPISDIEKIVKKAHGMNICVIIDEAYGDFMDNNNSAISLVNKYDNLMVLRTFSKGLGLAGLRVGYMICGKELQKLYSLIESPFSISNFSEYVSIEALKDKSFIDDCTKKIAINKKTLINACQKIKVLETDLSVPVLVLMHPNENANLYELLLSEGAKVSRGEDFMTLSKNFIRLRVPADVTLLLKAIQNIEKLI